MSSAVKTLVDVGGDALDLTRHCRRLWWDANGIAFSGPRS